MFAEVLSKIRSIYFLLAILLIEVILLISDSNELRNSKLLIDAGQNILNRESPYSTPNPYGSSPGLIFALIDKLSPFGSSVIVIILLNLWGYIYMVKFIWPNINFKILIIITIISFLSSPIRALVSNVQNSGLIIGISLVGIYFYRVSTERRKFYYLLLSSFCFVFALELKPQLIFPLIIVFIFQQRSHRLLILICAEIISIRLLLNLWTGQILELEQYRIWKVMRNDDLAIKEQISFWKALDNMIALRIDWFSFSFWTVLILTTILAFFSLKHNSKQLIVLALFLPLLSGYLQYYSLLPLLAVLVYQVLLGTNSLKYGSMFSLTILILPTYLGSHFKIFDVLLVITANAFLALVMPWNSLRFITNLVESLCALVVVHLVAVSTLELEVGLSFLIFLIYLLQIPNLLGKVKSLV
jgi:hypothetical protein